jgi:hypothetical protein
MRARPAVRCVSLRLAVSACLLASAPPVFAQVEDAGAGKRFRAIVNGAFAPAALKFAESRLFTEFAEQATLDARYDEKAGPGFDLGLQYNVGKRFGVLAGVSRMSRSGSGSFAAVLPHPLYFNQLRKAEGRLEGLHYSETAGHLDLVGSARSGPFELAVFGGATLFSVKTDVVDKLEYSHSYPYDSVTITGVPKQRVSRSPKGWNVGGRADYALGRERRFGVGLQLRYSEASVAIAPSEGNSFKFNAGGLQLAAGARFFF